MASSNESKPPGNGDEKPTKNLPDSDSSSNEEEAASVGTLYERMLDRLGLLIGDKPKVLDEKSIDGIVKYIKEKKCKNIITLAGAGISTSSGIPDFRSPGSGLYHNLQKYNLPNPHAIFEIDFFQENPKPFFHLAKELYPGMFKPTVCHYFIKLLQEKGLLLRHYTQNIDTLERVAGIPDEVIVEAHGTFHTSHCLGCNEEYPLEWMKERIFSDVIPKCEKCEYVVKPDIVFFGENSPAKFFRSVSDDFEKCDLLIILGSSLTVQPFASLIDRVPNSCPRLLVNRTRAGEHDLLRAFLGQGSGMDFDSEENTRDVAWLGDCDDGCRLLASKLGWGDELDLMVMTEHMKILSVEGEKKSPEVKPEPEKLSVEGKKKSPEVKPEPEKLSVEGEKKSPEEKPEPEKAK